MERKCHDCGSTTKDHYFCCVVCDRSIDFKCLGIKSKTTFELIIQLKNLCYICNDCNDLLKSRTGLFSNISESVDVIKNNIINLQEDVNAMSSSLRKIKKHHFIENYSVVNKKNNNDMNGTVTVPTIDQLVVPVTNTITTMTTNDARCDKLIDNNINKNRHNVGEFSYIDKKNKNINCEDKDKNKNNNNNKTNNGNILIDNINSCVTEPRPVDNPVQNIVCFGNNSGDISTKNHLSVVKLVHASSDNLNINNNHKNIMNDNVDVAISVQKEQVPSHRDKHKHKRKSNKKHIDNVRLIQQNKVVIIGTATGGSASIGAIPPRKWIFVSRLQPTVTDSEFKNFIKNNLRIVDANCTRFDKNAGYVSYKVGVPLECFEAVMKAEAWPEHLLIKEYNFNQKTNFREVRQPPRTRL